ncbi:uncharacterized protein I206_105037 [Kwoniella pini CBS 10737]|uniref:Uncharacterized protein n=1 Tax=Kwoniella pini CBS 10737 TaxID=1296096 RepID=A0A1B9I8X8_9TREE|nr:uncharacterized protein I206_02577 [Kwoniella pini CBS 10737]OCF51861.1 hypothetical protein I206_02577 [Kwoniella pini CBS 10737]
MSAVTHTTAKDQVKATACEQITVANDPVEFYHSLPDLDHALLSISKINFETLLDKVSTLLAPYGDKYGLSLLHRHFSLEEGEIMVESGNIMKPIIPAKEVKLYEKRWDRNGKPYEYSTEQQEPVPSELLKDFRKIVPEFTSLGIYSRKGDDETIQWMEYTDVDDRTHINRPRNKDSEDAPQTAWYSKDGAPLTRGCGGTCVKNTLRSGKVRSHTKIAHKKK